VLISFKLSRIKLIELAHFFYFLIVYKHITFVWFTNSCVFTVTLRKKRGKNHMQLHCRFQCTLLSSLNVHLSWSIVNCCSKGAFPSIYMYSMLLDRKCYYWYRTLDTYFIKYLFINSSYLYFVLVKGMIIRVKNGSEITTSFRISLPKWFLVFMMKIVLKVLFLPAVQFLRKKLVHINIFEKLKEILTN